MSMFLPTFNMRPTSGSTTPELCGQLSQALKLAPEWDGENGNQDSMKHTADGLLVRQMKVVDPEPQTSQTAASPSAERR